MSFANQALAAEYIVENAASLEQKVYDVPEDIDNEIARLKLETMGIDIDKLSAEQEKYLASWDEGYLATEGTRPRRGVRNAAQPAHRRLPRRCCCRLPGGRCSTTCSTRCVRWRSSRASTSSRTPASRRSSTTGRPEDVTVHDDGTASNDDRLGAIGDMRSRSSARG